MAASSDVTVAQDGGATNAKLHPYLVTLVRWCISCIWSTATVLLHRLVTTPLPSIAAKPVPRGSPKPRPAGTDHLHPEPRVECVVLHQPDTPTLDVIFVHGLYGSLGNTWRQGDWGSKYKTGPNKVHLRNHEKCTTDKTSCDYESEAEKENFEKQNEKHFEYSNNLKETKYQINSFKKILPQEDEFITENFYNNTILDQIEVIDNYESQAKFVQDLFKSDFKSKLSNVNETCKCKVGCDVGCGCVCDQCYSDCWPKDWIQHDFPGARVISINYTSDPYLWRPLWVKESKRLRLHERADQMMDQLLALGVGSRPIVWVGHSKGGLFIKQIYCDAYEAHKTLHKDREMSNQEFTEHRYENRNLVDIDNGHAQSSKNNEDTVACKADIWVRTAGFMFYSVPHRGSPLADFKTPITARSVELMEICKDCSLVVSLHHRWLAAAWRRPPVVSLVETTRTLMSVLWLRIVSVDSADAGIGTLSGISVDHREICKPSSRTCQLYTDLTDLIRSALAKCDRK